MINNDNELNSKLINDSIKNKPSKKHVKSILKKTLIRENTDSQIKNIIVNKNKIIFQSLIDNKNCWNNKDITSSEHKKIHGIKENSIDIKIHSIENWKEDNKIKDNEKSECCKCTIF